VLLRLIIMLIRILGADQAAHRMERQQLSQAHERSREREIGVSQRAFERAAERKEQTQEERRGWYRGLSE
jgi:hypothetical protein